MKPPITTIDLRIHPLDPRRIGPDGLVEKLTKLFIAGLEDVEMKYSYGALVQAINDQGGLAQAS